MKTLLLASMVALAATGTALADTASTSGPVCLRTMDIRDTSTPDDRTIVFHMNNGAVWRNDLKSTCPELRFNGFAYVATPPNEICGNLQIIKVIRAGSVCSLGAFTQVKPART